MATADLSPRIFQRLYSETKTAFPVKKTEFLTFIEPNIAGTILLPHGVKFVVAEFPSLFGTALVDEDKPPLHMKIMWHFVFVHFHFTCTFYIYIYIYSCSCIACYTSSVYVAPLLYSQGQKVQAMAVKWGWMLVWGMGPGKANQTIYNFVLMWCFHVLFPSLSLALLPLFLPLFLPPANTPDQGTHTNLNMRILDPLVVAHTSAVTGKGGNVTLPADTTSTFTAQWEAVSRARNSNSSSSSSKLDIDPASWDKWFSVLAAPALGLKVSSGLKAGQCADIDRCVGVFAQQQQLHDHDGQVEAEVGGGTCVCYGA